jgi:hypothetical protein
MAEIKELKNGKKIIRPNRKFDGNKMTGQGVVIKDGKAMDACQAKVKTYGNIWTREVYFKKAGEIKKGHKHEFDHLHFVASGSVKISVYDANDKDKPILIKNYTAPAWIKVPKEHFHDIVALEDETRGYCIQAIVNKDGDVVDTDYAYDQDWIDEVNEFERKNGLLDETIKD